MDLGCCGYQDQGLNSSPKKQSSLIIISFYSFISLVSGHAHSKNPDMQPEKWASWHAGMAEGIKDGDGAARQEAEGITSICFRGTYPAGDMQIIPKEFEDIWQRVPLNKIERISEHASSSGRKRIYLPEYLVKVWILTSIQIGKVFIFIYLFWFGAILLALRNYLWPCAQE